MITVRYWSQAPSCSGLLSVNTLTLSSFTLTPWLHHSRRVLKRCKSHFKIYTFKLLQRQRAPALPKAKIEVSSICDADRAASPASPISSVVYRSRYPHAISSLVIPTWVIERQTVIGRGGNTMKVPMPITIQLSKSPHLSNTQNPTMHNINTHTLKDKLCYRSSW